MSSRPLVVADFDFGAAERLPPGSALVAEGIRREADWVAVTLHATADGWGVVHPQSELPLPDGTFVPIRTLDLAAARDAPLAGGRLNTLEEVLLEAHRARLGLLLRIADTRALAPLAGGLGVMGGDGPAALRPRFLAVVPDATAGKRLRAEVPDVPSALELTGAARGLRGRFLARFPNLGRAAADADDLLMPAEVFEAHPQSERLVSHLARRGARLWLAGVAAGDEERWAQSGAAGLLVVDRV